MRIPAFVLAILCAAASFGQSKASKGASAGDLHVLSSNGIRAVVEKMMPAVDAAVRRHVAIEYATSTQLRKRVESGEAFDVVLITSPNMDAVASAGKVDAATRVKLGSSGIGIGARAGAPKPDIRTPEAVKQTLLKAKSITYARDGASRMYIERMTEQLGIAAEVRAKTMMEPSSTGATADVAEGRVELVLTLASEIIPVKGVTFVGLLPAKFQDYITIEGAVGAKAVNKEAARAFLGVLASPAADAALKANGMERR